MPELIFRGGRLPADPARPTLKLADYLTATPTRPASADWLSQVPVADWGMEGNDQWGDCTCAAVAHKRIGDVFDNQAGRVLAVSTQETLALYTAVTGFDPNAGPPGSNPTDNGAQCADVLSFWNRTGFLGEKIFAYAKVDVTNLAEVKQAIGIFGQLYCGFNFPTSAMSQFNAGQPWTVVQGASIDGGHCVTVGAYDADGLSCVTWGAVQRMDWSFWSTYFDEAYVIVTPDMIDPASGVDVQGVDLYALGQDYAALTGRANPIPAPAPTPSPSPVPAPTPAPVPTPKPSLWDWLRRILHALGL